MADLDPEIIAYAVPPLKEDGTRCLPSCMRIKRIGQVYFVEQLHYSRDANDKIEENWKVAAVAKPTPKEPDARMDAFIWMQDAHRAFINRTLGDASPRRMGE